MPTLNSKASTNSDTVDPWRLEEAFFGMMGLSEAERARQLAAITDRCFKSQLERLLAAHELGRTPCASAPTEGPEPIDHCHGEAAGPTAVGRYTILERLGEGGAGEVFLARLHDDSGIVEFAPKVALKILKPGLCHRDGIERFKLERRVLARLDHPNIAKIFDGGTHSDGRPYFVMEYVAGRAIDEYCRIVAASSTQRIELLLALARTVMAAHERWVLHRDLKPSNVLVSADGGVKLLDFGLAKCLRPIAGVLPAATTGARWFTPDYAAPEQFLDQSVDERSDLYALGLIAYRMMSGTGPFDRSFIGPKSGDFSTEYGELPALASLSRVRAINHAKTGSARASSSASIDLRDLDAVIRRAINPNIGDRYPNVEAFCHDLESLLQGRPVAVPSETEARWHRSLRRVFARPRRTWALAGGPSLVLVLCLVAVLGIDAVQRAERVEARARLQSKVTSQLASFTLREREWVASTEQTRARYELLGLAREFARHWSLGGDDWSREPLSALRFALVGGSIHNHLGAYDRAEAIYAQASASFVGEATPAADRLELALERGFNLIDFERFPKAHKVFEQAAHYARTTVGSNHPQYTGALFGWAASVHGLGRYEDDWAERTVDQVIAALSARGVARPRELAKAHDLAAAIALARSDYPQARRHAQRSFELARDLYGSEAPQTMAYNQTLGTLAVHLGDLKQALALYEHGAFVSEAHLGAEHPRTATAYYCLAAAKAEAGQLDAALDLHMRALKARQQSLGPRGSAVSASLHAVAMLEAQLGDIETAMARHREALHMRAQFRPADSLPVGDGYYKYGTSLLAAGRPEAAVALLERALVLHEAQLPSEHALLVRVHLKLAAAHRAGRELDVAFEHARVAHDMAKSILGTEHWRYAEALGLMAHITHARRHEANAAAQSLAQLERAVGILDDRLGVEHPLTQRYARWLSQSVGARLHGRCDPS